MSAMTHLHAGVPLSKPERCRMTEPSIRPFARAHLDGLIALVAAEAGMSTRRTSSGLVAR